jgi:hypothetical protein
MKESQVIELVLIDGNESGEQLFVMEWEYDRANDKIVYLKLISLCSWLKGRRDHPDFVAPKGNPVLFKKDDPCYFNTSHRLTCAEQGDRWFDEYGRSYTKTGNNLSIADLRLCSFPLEELEKLSEEEIIMRMNNGGSLDPERFDREKPAAAS